RRVRRPAAPREQVGHHHHAPPRRGGTAVRPLRPLAQGPPGARGHAGRAALLDRLHRPGRDVPVLVAGRPAAAGRRRGPRPARRRRHRAASRRPRDGAAAGGGPPMTAPPPAVPFRLGRLLRFARKELREVLRDRRTILTLVLTPLLLY